jgi:hypothetical protein
MAEYNIKNFENFIYGVNFILTQTNSDLIKWQPHYSREAWEKISFHSKVLLSSS